MPEDATMDQILTVWYNLQKITDDKLTFNLQESGNVSISIASKGKG